MLKSQGREAEDQEQEDKMAFDKTWCPHCSTKLEVRFGSPLRFCRCPKCGKDFVMHWDETFEFPYEYSEARIVDLEAEREQEMKQREEEEKEWLMRDQQRAIDDAKASIRTTLSWMTPQEKAAAIRDMEITGNYWDLETGKSYKRN